MTPNPVSIIKTTGQTEVFQPEKLMNSLLRSGVNEIEAEAIVSHIEREIVDGMSTSEIYTHAFSLIKRKTPEFAARYSLRRALIALGPTGFPFEKFIAEVMKAKGYEAITDQIVKGECVEHEMDVVAWKGNELIMIEVKFHNEAGLKSDVKVALYIKSRFDDLRNGIFEFGGKKFSFGEGWLVTNTKFSDQAKRYMKCKGLKIIGWDYPEKGNLEDLILESNLHPITCLATLSTSQKQALLQSGYVLCRQIVDKKINLEQYGVDKNHVLTVMDEVANVCGVV